MWIARWEALKRAKRLSSQDSVHGSPARVIQETVLPPEIVPPNFRSTG